MRFAGGDDSSFSGTMGGGEGGSGSDDSPLSTPDWTLGVGDGGGDGEGAGTGSDDSVPGWDKSAFKMLTFLAFCSLCSRFLNFVSERRT